MASLWRVCSYITTHLRYMATNSVEAMEHSGASAGLSGNTLPCEILFYIGSYPDTPLSFLSNVVITLELYF